MADIYDRQSPELLWAEEWLTRKQKQEYSGPDGIECPECGAMNPPNAKVCSECGASLVPVGSKSKVKK